MLKSIYSRTFLLVLAAIVVIHGVGLLLPAGRPDLTGRALGMDEIAAQLRERGPPPELERAADADPRSGPPDPPPGSLRRFEAQGLPRMPSLLGTRVVQNQPEAPEGSGLIAAEKARALLAEHLGQRTDSVVFFATPSELRRATETLEPTFAKSFMAAARLSDGGWRVLQRQAESFPSAAQRRGLEQLALELAVLLPLAYIFARALASPLKRFAAAAQRMGQEANAPLTREGPAEVEAAVDSFNAMQSRLAHLLQERTRMVGAMAHDLRTPLTRLTFRLDELPAPLGDKVRADIQEMKSMISAALDFIRDRSVGAQRERLDFRLLVERVVNDLADLGHDVVLEPGAPITLNGAPLALRRLTSNLIENALKYGERARVGISSNAAHCVLEIDDDGPGIPESLQEQVFEPFFRVEGSRNRDTGGIGLGLAAVRAIVLEHGGEIGLGNRKAGGLRVSVTLPLA